MKIAVGVIQQVVVTDPLRDPAAQGARLVVVLAFAEPNHDTLTDGLLRAESGRALGQSVDLALVELADVEDGDVEVSGRENGGDMRGEMGRKSEADACRSNFDSEAFSSFDNTIYHDRVTKSFAGPF
ncbi:MAG: hypothetical protein AB7D39_06355 [Pseudodesulfovibrio sp.]|uniref:hypothetical protein n=1 Tax=Pseudodesulfovibrio sp. TaxID=2035812 RepID=UPI003D13C457